CLQGYSAPFTF
nr:immunoglobulin light chain junction region [Macaca mulatta]MOV78140.1 immunoglobulin light chain junction region [Macaca mulatta]MOV78603.1 immunoglobulin light chain junction region [Macaca mulatta]MOV78965.1 immunoglobulin light chain junction region [Macaca mulatta]MOV79209.1 immunoglobulin light chain junction region [Macaca mulatta]